MKLFRTVENGDMDQSEEEDFKKWAHDNYIPFSSIKGIWHPIVQKECIKINENSEVEDIDRVLISEIKLRTSGQEDALKESRN